MCRIYIYFFKKMQLLLIFQIFVHVAVCSNSKTLEALTDPSSDQLTKLRKYDKILLNLHHLLRNKADENTTTESTGQLDSNVNLSQNEGEHVPSGIEQIKAAFAKFREEILNVKNDGAITVEVPVNRRKRDIDDQVTNVTLVEENSNESNETTTEVPEVETVNELEEKPVELKSSEKNDTESGRRMIPPTVITTSRVKNKLLSYLEDTFNEVEMKIKPLTNIKIALSNDDNYRIGYIIATIDTLDVNLKKLKNDMKQNQHVWSDEKILDLFDRIKATNTVATTLIESLKKYLPKH